MSADSALDRESLQNLLASAFVVQESLMDAQSRSAIIELLHLIMAGELDADGAMHLIADRARNIANATGVAIGLLKGDQLVYRAGSGSAATYIGRHVVATLSVSGNSETRREILRVEDAQTDVRIEAAICRQFGANSLLILPIYYDRALAGVLEIFFNEAHAFDNREVYTYQLLARVVEKAMCVQGEQKQSWAAESSTMVQRIAPQMQRFPSDSGLPANRHAVRKTCRAALAEIEKLPSQSASPAAAAIMSAHRAKRVRSHIRIWRVADRAAVVTVLVAASWIAYTYRRPLGASARQRSNAIERQLPSVPAKLMPVNKDVSRLQTSAIPLEERKKAERSTLQRVRVGDDAIDYISEDVTVRHFTPKPALRQERVGGYEVDYISEDVTVRRFSPKPAVLPTKSNADAFRP
jgi:putative methionine-R-sulfoxide reductase with GAF domain